MTRDEFVMKIQRGNEHIDMTTFLLFIVLEIFTELLDNTSKNLGVQKRASPVLWLIMSLLSTVYCMLPGVDLQATRLNNHDLFAGKNDCKL